MERYPNISDHGLIGDLQTAALVSTDGTIDWFCCPRFDSPSIFASLLDAGKGGYFRVAPDTGDYVTRQLYFPDTAVLITRFMTPDGVGEVTDFMPVAGASVTDRHRLVRMLRVVRGTMRFVVDIKPRFDYGRRSHKMEISDDGVVFDAGGMHLTLHPVGERTVPLGEQGILAERVGEDVRLSRTLHEGETAGMVLESMGGRPSRVPPAEIEHLTEDTVRYWRGRRGRSPPPRPLRGTGAADPARVPAGRAGPGVAPAGAPTCIVDGGVRALPFWGIDDHQYLLVNRGEPTWPAALDVTAGAGLATAAGALEAIGVGRLVLVGVLDLDTVALERAVDELAVHDDGRCRC